MKRIALCLSMALLAATSDTAMAGCGGLQSSPSTQPADVTFTNKTAENVKVLWFNFMGGTKQYRLLAPTQSYVQATFRNHVWGFTDAKGKCRGTFVVHGNGRHAIR